MSAKQTVKNSAKNDNTNDEFGKVPVPPTVEPFDFNGTLNAAERDVEAAFVALVLFIASQSQSQSVDNIVHRLADVLDSEGKAPAVKYNPGGSALHKRLKRLFGNKGVLTIANMARAVVDRAPIIG